MFLKVLSRISRVKILTLDTYLKINNREKDDFIEKDIKPAAVKRLQQELVIDEISRQEKIELDQKELQKEFTKTFMQMQSAPNFRGLQKEFTTKKFIQHGGHAGCIKAYESTNPGET